MEISRCPVTVCLLSLNEAESLNEGLERLKGFAEVLVCLTGSTDNSEEVCEAHGVRYFHDEWGGLAENRKMLFERATQPWILWLDADERLTDRLEGEIRYWVERADAPAGFSFNRLTLVDGHPVRHGVWFPEWTVRLFRAGDWSIREKGARVELTVPGEVKQLEGLLEHHLDAGQKVWENRVDRHARHWAANEFLEGRRVTVFDQFWAAVGGFWQSYFRRRGFLDGRLGYRVAKWHARYCWLKNQRLRRKWTAFGGVL